LGLKKEAEMVDINAPNLITVGLISVAAWAVANMVMVKLNMKMPGA
jgi:hypothetical protein